MNFFFLYESYFLVMSLSDLCLTQDHKDFLLGFVLDIVYLGPWFNLNEFLFIVWNAVDSLPSFIPSFFSPLFPPSLLLSFFLFPDEHLIQLFISICWTETVFSPLNCLCTIDENLFDYMCRSISGLCSVPLNVSVLLPMTECLDFCSFHYGYFPFHFVLILYSFRPLFSTPQNSDLYCWYCIETDWWIKGRTQAQYRNFHLCQKWCLFWPQTVLTRVSVPCISPWYQVLHPLVSSSLLLLRLVLHSACSSQSDLLLKCNWILLKIFLIAVYFA